MICRAHEPRPFGLEVILRQDFLCVEGTGGAVWRPSICFAEFVCGTAGRQCLPISGKSVLEVSSGLGLGTIVAWHLGASIVVRHTHIGFVLIDVYPNRRGNGITQESGQRCLDIHGNMP